MDRGAMPARWAAHPRRARALRWLVYTIPVAGSLVFVRLATALTGTPTSSLAVFLAWWFGMSAAATVVVSLVYAATKRLLPVGALLELSLAFPREAPSRFRLALATGTVEELTTRLQDDPGRDPQEACEILLRLAASLDDHDRITRGHSERVRAYAFTLGRELGLDQDELDRLNWSALLHDVGKLSVSGEILNKPGKPDDDEWRQLRSHPLYGESLVAPLRSWLGDWADAVGYHHERWDGAGYPRGTAGEAIPLAGRIVAIADVYDVITSSRSYKEPAPAAAAREEIVRCSGTQFDPRLVRAFVNISLGRMRVVMGPLSWLTHAPYLGRLPLAPSLGVALGGISAFSAATITGMTLPRAAATAATVRQAPPAPAALTLTRPRRTRRPVVAAHPHVALRPTVRISVVRRAHRPATPRRVPTAPTPAKETTGAPTTTAAADQPRTPAPAPAAPKTPPPPAAETAPATASPAAASTPPPAPTTTGSPTPTPPPPPANTPPSFRPGPDELVLEDSGPTTVAGWATAISAGDPGQTVTFSTGVSVPQLFAAPPSVAADGTLTFTPAANANGAATVTVTAHDGQEASPPATFTITVVAVNDAPSFTPGGNQTAVSLLGAQTVAGWASSISPGPPDEAGQSVSFVVSVDKPGLFAVLPTIAPNGTLSYRPTALALGTARVSVRAVDDGGTANGGSDTSPTVTFTITIV